MMHVVFNVEITLLQRYKIKSQNTKIKNAVIPEGMNNNNKLYKSLNLFVFHSADIFFSFVDTTISVSSRIQKGHGASDH